MRAYPSIQDVPDEVDLAVIVVPRDFVQGVVEDCGRKGVKALIVISAGFGETGETGCASYVARAPASLELTRAGAVPIVGLTAHETLTDIMGVHQGDVVLITAAAGGVGHLAVQIATGLGAHVVATASGRNHDFVRALGAQTVIDYTAEDMVAAIRTLYPDGVDKARTASRARPPTRLSTRCAMAGRCWTSPGWHPSSGPGSASIPDTWSEPMPIGSRACPA